MSSWVQGDIAQSVKCSPHKHDQSSRSCTLLILVIGKSEVGVGRGFLKVTGSLSCSFRELQALVKGSVSKTQGGERHLTSAFGLKTQTHMCALSPSLSLSLPGILVN